MSNTHMKYFIPIIFSFLVSVSFTFASEKNITNEKEGWVQHTSHPPHDHPVQDHIKKLDEGMHRRRNNKREEAHKD